MEDVTLLDVFIIVIIKVAAALMTQYLRSHTLKHTDYSSNQRSPSVYLSFKILEHCKTNQPDVISQNNKLKHDNVLGISPLKVTEMINLFSKQLR